MQSKEQLIAENANLKQQAIDYRDQDRDLREEMSKVLGQGGYNYNSSNKTLSWFEIFALIGQLKQVQEDVMHENKLAEDFAKEELFNNRREMGINFETNDHKI